MTALSRKRPASARSIPRIWSRSRTHGERLLEWLEDAHQRRRPPRPCFRRSRRTAPSSWSGSWQSATDTNSAILPRTSSSSARHERRLPAPAPPPRRWSRGAAPPPSGTSACWAGRRARRRPCWRVTSEPEDTHQRGLDSHQNSSPCPTRPPPFAKLPPCSCPFASRWCPRSALRSPRRAASPTWPRRSPEPSGSVATRSGCSSPSTGGSNGRGSRRSPSSRPSP